MKFTSPVYSTASGSIAGITYSRNRFGLYTRARTNPVDPNSTRQQNLRSIFNTSVQAWLNSLSAAQRTAWNTWAANTTIVGKDGLPVNITGQNAFIRYNTAAIQAGGAMVLDGPIIFNNGAPPTRVELSVDGDPDLFGVNVGATALSIKVLVAGGASDDGDVSLFLAAPVNADRTFFKGPYQLASVEAIAASAGFINFTDVWNQLLSDNGDPTPGETRGLKARVIYDDGRLSEPYSLLSLVTEETI